MATNGGPGPPIPTRPTVIKPSRGEADLSQGNGDPSQSTAPKRPPPAVPPQRPSLVPVAKEPSVSPRPQPSAPTRGSASTKRSRPVITVVEARPMNQVGFRDEIPSDSKNGSKDKPEISVVAGRPMSEVGFCSEGSISPSGGQPGAPSQEVPAHNNRPTSTIERGPVESILRHKPKGAAPPRPTSMPVKPTPGQGPSMSQQHRASQNIKLPGMHGDRILTPDASSGSDKGHKMPPPRPVSRPQSLHIAAGNKGGEQDTPSESSGYSSQMTTSESHSSLSSVEWPAEAPPVRKKPIGVQVLPIGPDMLKHRKEMKSSSGEQPLLQASAPVPSPRASQRSPTPPSPRPRQRNLTPDTNPITESEACTKEADKDTPALQMKRLGVAVLPVAPPRAPSPCRETSQLPTAQMPTMERPVEEEDTSNIEINPWADINQNKQTFSPPVSSKMIEESIKSPTGAKVEPPPVKDTSPPALKPRPSVKPKPAVKPKPKVAAKPKPPTMVKPGQQGPAKPARLSQMETSPTNKLYPSLSQDLEAPAPVSPSMQSSSPSASASSPPAVSPPAISPPVSPKPEFVENISTKPEIEIKESRGKSAKVELPQRPQRPIKATPELESPPEGEVRPPRPQSPGKRLSVEKPPMPPLPKITVCKDDVQKPQQRSLSPEKESISKEAKTESQIVPEPERTVSPTSVIPVNAGEAKKEIQSQGVDSSVSLQSVEGQQNLDKQELPSEKELDTVIVDTSEKKLYPSLPKSVKPLPQKKVVKDQANDSFSDDDPADDPFYTKRNGQSVVDTSLLSLVADEKETNKEKSKLKKYFSETEIKEKENTDPAEAFYREHPEILTTDVAKPIRYKRPTIIRPKKVPVPETGDSEKETAGESPEKVQEFPAKQGSEEESHAAAPVVAKRPTIIRATKPASPSQEEKTETEPPVRPKKIPPPVRPKPKSVRLSREIPASPPKPLPKPQKKPTTPPPPVQKSSTPKPSSVEAQQEPQPTPPILMQSLSPRKAPARPPSGPPASPSLLSKVQASLGRTPSVSSLEESDNKLNEMRIRRESGSSIHSEDKVRPGSAASSAGSESSVTHEPRKPAPETPKKSWIPPGAVKVMGGPPPLPRMGPVAVSTPDLRIDPTAETDSDETKPEGGEMTPSTDHHSHSPQTATGEPISKTRPKSMSMMALHRPTIEQEQSSPVAHEGRVQEEQTEKSGNEPSSKPMRPAPARPVAPSRPCAPPRKARPSSIDSTPEESEAKPVSKQLPERPPPSPRARKMPPARAPPPKVPKERPPPPALPDRPGPGHPLYHYVVQGPHGIALFDYTAKADDELSFKAGDVLELDEVVSEAWMVGRNVDKKGIFPSNFIDVIEAPPVSQTKHQDPVAPGPSAEQDQVPGTGPRCVARFDYESEVDGDLTFTSGDVITLIGRNGEDWLKGRLDGKEGAFPVAFVEVVEDVPAPCDPGPLAVDSTDTASPTPTSTATFDYSGEAGDLSFKKGDTIQVLSKLNEDWLFGQTAVGATGIFPATFVDHVPLGLPAHNPSSASDAGRKVKATEPPTTPSEQEEEEAYCIAEYDFAGAEGDLDFLKGDRIVLTGRIGADWLRGTCGGRTGTFPKNFVKVMKDLADHDAEDSARGTEREPAGEPVTGMAVALYDYPGDSDADLSLKVGDEVVLVEKVGDDWYQGAVGNQRGMFPASFVKVIKPLPSDAILQPPESFA